MKPIPALGVLLDRAVKLGVFGTKMRSVINLPSRSGIAAIAAQQFEIAAQIAEHDLMAIIEPEALIKSPDKKGAEAILLAELTRKLDELPGDRQVMLKLTIPDVPDLSAPLMKHDRVARVVALSGGYGRTQVSPREQVDGESPNRDFSNSTITSCIWFICRGSARESIFNLVIWLATR